MTTCGRCGRAWEGSMPFLPKHECLDRGDRVRVTRTEGCNLRVGVVGTVVDIAAGAAWVRTDERAAAWVETANLSKETA